MGNKWGFHSGVGHMKDCKVGGDLYVQDDIVFSDVRAGVLGVTGGIDMTGTTSAIGINFTGGSFSTGAIMAGTGTATPQTMAEAEDFVIGIYTTCADTDGANTAKPLYVNAAYTGAGQVARAAEFVIRPTVQLGGWVNAIKAYTDFSTTSQAGGAAGLISSINAEMRLPNGACTGHFFPIEVEWVGQASTSFSTVGTGAGSGFLWLKANGTVTDFDSDGVFMSVQGLTAGSGKLLSANKQTLRCDVDYGTLRYLVLSQAENILSLVASATVGAISIDAGTTNHAADGNILDINLDIEGNYSVNAINVNLDFETTGMLGTDKCVAFNADINELIVHGNNADLHGADITITGFATGRCDLVGYHITLDGSKTEGDKSAGFKVVSTQTINHSGEELYGSWINLSGITHTDGDIYGQYLDVSFTNNSTAYGLYINSGTNLTAAIAIAGTPLIGISIGATATSGITFTGTLVSGINFSGATLAPGASGAVSDFALEIGSRTTELDITFAGGAGVENFEPVQLKCNFIGVNPASESKVNMIYQQLTHDTIDMSNLRLKCADFTITVAKNVKDVYAYQGEIDFSGTSTIGGEAAVVGYTMNCGSGTVSGTVYGGLFAMRGTSTPSGSSSAIFLSARTSGMTLTNAIYIEPVSGSTITNGIYINEAGTLTNFAKWAGTGTSIIASDNAMTTQNTSHAIRIAVGGSTYYIPVFDTSNWS